MNMPFWSFEKEETVVINKLLATIKTTERIEHFVSTRYVQELDCIS
jgi:hypothetical protein